MSEGRPFSRHAVGALVQLRILATTDVHVALLSYDYYSDAPNEAVGLSRTATLVDQARSEAANSLLVDNGDFLQGNPMGDFIACERGLTGDQVHPVIKAMNALDYACATIGNHEFNYGLDFLLQAVDKSNFPFVCANLTTGALADEPTADALHLQPYAMLDRQVVDTAGGKHTVRIGLIGFVPPQVMMWDAKNLEGRAMVRDIIETAQAWVPRMRAAGADIVIALSHSGIAAGDEPGKENASLQLADVAGIDAIIAGHQHFVFPGTADIEEVEGADPVRGALHGKPAVMPGFFGSHLGVIDLTLKGDGSNWRPVDFCCEARPICPRGAAHSRLPAASSPQIEAAVAADHAATLNYIRTPVGHSSVPLQSYFALVADDASIQIVADAQRWRAGALLDGSAHAGLPVLSAAAPFKCGGRGGADYYTDVPAGALAIKNIADLYLYPNTFRCVRITGSEVREWLEMSAGMFRQVTAGARDAELLSPAFSAYNFDVLDGVTYEIDIGVPAKYDFDGRLADASASRIRNLRFEGKPIDPARHFIVATNNYRAGGGGNYPGIAGDKVVIETTETNRDIVIEYVRKLGSIDPVADGNWTLVAPSKTTVVFESSPKAQAFIGDVKGAAIEPAGPGTDGFARYRIRW